MQTRLAFNSGEVDEEVSLRMDVDSLSRACLRLENWEVSDMGGIRRRSGFRWFANGTEESVLLPFVYTYAEAENMRFLVEVRRQEVNVWGLNGELVTRFESGEKTSLKFDFDPKGLRYKQINKLLIITSLTQKPWVIKHNDDGSWEMEPYEFKRAPWKRSGSRDCSIKLTHDGKEYTVTFPDEADDEEKDLYSFDLLRLSYWTEQTESRAGVSSLTDGVQDVEKAPKSAKAGDKFAVRSEEIITYWTCKSKFSRDDLYCDGLDDPSSYPDNFVKAENTEDFENITPVLSVKDLGASVERNTKIAMKSGYWEYYTCIADFELGEDEEGELSDFPSNFIRGLAVGDAVLSGGAWSFFCSGLWYGSYEVRRNYNGEEISSDWETRGISFSQVASASNTQISGNEEEECYLRLFITRSRYMGDSIKSGFPPDGCDNKLIVESYKHDEILECHKLDDYVYWENKTPLPGKVVPSREIAEWSWSSFSPRYGFPLLCEVFNQRLVFASTPAQPQTLWVSALDDITNFSIGTKDNSAMELTINDTSQNPMCWIQSQNSRLLVGTSEAEWVISEGQAGFTPTSAKVTDHGHIGSSGVASLATSDKILYVERGGGRVYEYGYSYESDAYLSQDLTQLAPHIGRDHGGIISCTFIKKPNSMAVFVLGDGQLATCTYNRNQQVNAWGRWITKGEVLHAVALPNGNKNDLLFLLVRRENGVNIELYSHDNDYIDGEHDYESVLLTNALYNPLEQITKKSPQQVVLLRTGEDINLLNEEGKREPRAVQISGDGQTWADIDRGGAVWAKGWDVLVCPAGIKYEPMLGLKVKGKRSFSLFCIQA